jgi:5'-deoxynucleotidase YfbR-like HD superfamily hydrolase
MDEALAGISRKGIISPVGDIPRDIKYYNDDTYYTIKKVVDSNIQNNIHNKKIFEDINNAKGDDSFEAVVVSILDMLQSIIKLRRECYLQSFDYVILYRLDECLENYNKRVTEYAYAFDTKDKKKLHKEFKNIYTELIKEVKKQFKDKRIDK